LSTLIVQEAIRWTGSRLAVALMENNSFLLKRVKKA
jgi:hypothetical protein